MSKIRKFRKSLTDYLNDVTYDHFYNELNLMALSRFEWINLPDSIDVEYLEYCLYEFGKAVFFNHPKLGYMCLKVNPGSTHFNAYRKPTSVYAHGEDGTNILLKKGEFVIIRNNVLEVPTRNAMEHFAYRQYDAQRTADTNLFVNKLPYLLYGEDKEMLSLKRFIEKIGNNEPAIYGVKNSGLAEAIHMIDTKCQFIANDIMDYKKEIRNEAMTYLGIKNANVDKKERLITEEVEANDDEIELSIDLMLQTRKRACEEINKLFKLDNKVDVRLREYKTDEYVEDEEGEEDVSERRNDNNTKESA